MVRCRADVLSAVVAVLAVAACSAPSSTPTDRSDVANPTAGLGHVHHVELNPADGSVIVATHHGVFRLDAGAPVRVGPAQDAMGFAVTGPDQFLSSGHPMDGEPGPRHLGLLASHDAGRTWAAVALSGQADFHALSAVGATVYGFDSLTGTVLRSDDAGENWQRGARLDGSDLDADPTDPMRLLAATPQGLLESLDGGMGFAPVPQQPPRPLLAIDHVEYTIGTDRDPALAGVDESGGVWALEAGGWQASGSLPAAATTFTAIGPDRYLAATTNEILSSEDAGRSWVPLADIDS